MNVGSSLTFHLLLVPARPCLQGTTVKVTVGVEHVQLRDHDPPRGQGSRTVSTPTPVRSLQCVAAATSCLAWLSIEPGNSWPCFGFVHTDVFCASLLPHVGHHPYRRVLELQKERELWKTRRSCFRLEMPGLHTWTSEPRSQRGLVSLSHRLRLIQIVLVTQFCMTYVSLSSSPTRGLCPPVFDSGRFVGVLPVWPVFPFLSGEKWMNRSISLISLPRSYHYGVTTGNVGRSNQQLLWMTPNERSRSNIISLEVKKTCRQSCGKIQNVIFGTTAQKKSSSLSLPFSSVID